jgi:hypothetical protein
MVHDESIHDGDAAAECRKMLATGKTSMSKANVMIFFNIFPSFELKIA